MAFLSDGDGFVLTLMKRASRGGHLSKHLPRRLFRRGEATVDHVNRRLTEDGFAVAAPERHHAYGFYVEAPGGFTVELGA